MSLNWDLRNVANKDEVCFFTATEDNPMRGEVKGERYVRPVTDAIIWWTLAVGMGRITKDNAAEFTVRVNTLQQLGGDPREHYITHASVVAHIGLVTNVTNETRAQFLKKVSRMLDRRVAALVREREAV